MKPFIKKSITIFAILSVLGGITGALGIFGAYLYLSPQLPDIDALKDVRLQVPLRVYARSGELIAEFGEMKRSPRKYEEFPELMVKAVLAAEDDRFFQHPGVDYQGLLRAVVHLIKTGEKGQGGSTITMQVARNFFLSREKTYLRKLNEIFLALKIEKELSKQEILELYLNKVYLGKRAYGFAASAQVYYGKDITELSIAQMAMIAGLPKAPSKYNPINNKERALIRRGYVLGRMRDLGFIASETYDVAMLEVDESDVHGQDIELEAPYIAEMVRSDIVEKYGQDAYTAGYQVYTTIDAQKQKAANTSLRESLLEYDRRHGYRGHLGHVELWDNEEGPEQWQAQLESFTDVGNLTPALVFIVYEQEAYAMTRNGDVVYLPWEKINWARGYIDDNNIGPELKKARERLAEGDVIYVTNEKQGCSWLAQNPAVSGSLVTLRPEDGAILSLVGGFDFFESKFNRVIQAKRQPGSSFKPFVYTAALDKGFTAASIINDAPVVFDAPGLEDTWRPENYSGKFYGPTRLREALINSRNLVSIRLLRDIGIGYATRYAERFGFDRGDLPRDLSLALGSGAVTPIELASGYTVFANGGFRVKPYLIDYVIGPDQQIIDMSQPDIVCKGCRHDDGTLPETEAEANDGGDTAESPRQVKAPAPAQQTPDKASILSEAMTDVERLQVYQGPRAYRLAQRMISAQTNFVINTMMQDVIRFGTGVRAMQLGRHDLAGKTGTTNDQRDAWFSGFNSEMVTIAWVGFDNPHPLGDRETGARAALPMWMGYMKEALNGLPENPLEQPQGIVSMRIDPLTGEPATAQTAGAIFEFFLAEQVSSDPDNPPTQVGVPGQNPSDITREIF